MALRRIIHKDARIALTRTQGRRAASWLIMAACLGAMMLLWGVALPWWVFVIIVAVPFVTLIGLGSYWAGQDDLAAASKVAAERAKKSAKSGAGTGASASKRKSNRQR